MKTFIIAALASIISMLPLDATWLTLMGKRFYGRQLGDLMAEKPNFPAAGVFYLIYALALSLFVIQPALQGNFSASKTFFYGAFFGFAAYATYDLTNQATLKSWPTLVTAVDMAWGALLTGTVAVVASLITRRFSA